ncbi:YbaK/EbsC family protein [Marinifilum flexuosum]|uniref:Cys-tRNA(Pro)/Cys-tRNA(Cys) deacylase n=1 Tax=Marinifilum flexuosum TaxID=1117708 RepID=A0A419X760_9BACT|nr:YbaK/EbsC family protein [Marinifilum flexuosum]RKE03571.1 Cys-tRNA(Pro)/Cys-tRNA(Cys) deacylase [Marinifilum flexuosum]
MKKTNAARIIDRADIEYAIIDYDTDPIEVGTERVSENTNLHVPYINKTLVLSENKTGVVVDCISGSSELKPNSIVQISENQKCTLAALKNIQELTSYICGGCSFPDPKKDYLVFLNTLALQLKQFSIKEGLRDKQIKINSIDFHSITKATLCRTSNPKLKLAC